MSMTEAVLSTATKVFCLFFLRFSDSTQRPHPAQHCQCQCDLHADGWCVLFIPGSVTMITNFLSHYSLDHSVCSILAEHKSRFTSPNLTLLAMTGILLMMRWCVHIRANWSLTFYYCLIKQPFWGFYKGNTKLLYLWKVQTTNKNYIMSILQEIVILILNSRARRK